METDKGIILHDILGSEAHSIMLHEQGMISRGELRDILSALELARKHPGEIPTEGFEDIHEAIEAFCISKAGMESAGKIHTGRSRNDQVALDTRMKVRDDLNKICHDAIELLRTLLSAAKKNSRSIMVMYTHLQQAQIGTFGHFMIAHADALLRDIDRLSSSYSRINLSPLGASAIGGSVISLNRHRVAELLGFSGIVNNSIDATTSRDVFLEYVSCLTILMTDISRLAEDLIIWSTSEFGYVELSDRYSSTSSAMPQKKNPDPLELIRSRTSLVIGDLVGMLSLVKSLPSGYSRDLQDLKPPLFDASLKAVQALQMMNKVVSSMTVRVDRMEKEARKSYAIALDVAEELVIDTGIPFRLAHKIVGSLVKTALDRAVPLEDLSLTDINRSLDSLGQGSLRAERVVDLVKHTTAESSVDRRKTNGSPSGKEHAKAVSLLAREISQHAKQLADRTAALDAAHLNLAKLVKTYTQK